MMNSIYSSSTLVANSRQCRVLNLLPGPFDAEIQVELSVMNLDDWKSEQYECLSYVWGDPSITKPILVNNHQVHHDALQHVRNSDESAKIWVDAVCINQADSIEKNHQVHLMADIYKRCTKVNIWLGKQESTGVVDGDAFRYLRHFEDNKHFHQLPDFHRDQINGTPVFKENDEVISLLDDFLTVGKSPWWTRAWTVHESLLPLRTRFMYAHWHATWEMFTAYNDLKNRHALSCCRDAYEKFTPAQVSEINK